MKQIFFSFILISLFIAGCKSKNNINEKVVTKRIQYDVTIEKPDEAMDWWMQNIDGQKREATVRTIIQQAINGKVKAYDFITNATLTPDAIKKTIKHIDTISVERSTPPYDLVDTVMVTEIKISDIKKLRFLEEWHMNEKSLYFTKKVLGICPMVEKRDEKGEIRGYQPLFWVFFDEKYPKEFTITGASN